MTKMTKRNKPSFADEQSLTQQLKSKNRDRRGSAARLAALGAAPHALRNDVLPKLELVQVALGDLRSQPRKVRKLDPGHAREIAASISALGFCVPVLIGKGNAVLDGEARVEAAKLLGLGSAPCVRIDHLSNEEQRVLRLAVNRLGEKGQWDLAGAEGRIRGADPRRRADRDHRLLRPTRSIRLCSTTMTRRSRPALLSPTERQWPSPGSATCSCSAAWLICGDATDPEMLAPPHGRRCAGETSHDR